jgi:cobalt-zinc-cadmium efflux system outer membrane protein
MRFLTLSIPAACLMVAGGALAQTPNAPAGPDARTPIPTAAPAPASAASAAGITLAQALQAARDNPDIAWARYAVAGARGDLQAADRAPLPVLSAKAGSMDLQNGLGPGNLWTEKRIDKGVGMDWTLERGNKRVLRTEGAQRALQATRLDLAETLVQQQTATAAAFYDLLAAQSRLEQVGALARSAGELADAAQRRLRAGDLSQQDALRTDIEARRAQSDLSAAQTDVLRAQLATVRAEADWPAASVPAPGSIGDLEQRPDLRAARARAEAAQSALDSALALRRSDVTVGASLDHQPGTSRRLLELRLQMPLSGVMGTYGYEGEIARARAGLDQAQAQLEKIQRAAAADQGRLLADLREAAARAARFQDEIVPRARQVAAMAELAYSKGAMPLVELIDARRTLRAVLLDEIAARADHGRAAAAWQLRQAPVEP